jgi:predicted enzyme related to lactoylglutathione lyase
MGYYALVAPESSGIGVGIGSEMEGGARTTAYVEVSDLKAKLDQAVAMGGKVLMEPMEIPGVVNFAMFADPEGNVIGLTKPV